MIRYICKLRSEYLNLTKLSLDSVPKQSQVEIAWKRRPRGGIKQIKAPRKREQLAQSRGKTQNVDET